MNLIDRAAQALLAAENEADPWDRLDAVHRDRLREAVRAVLRALREPDERMVESGTEIIRNVGPSESRAAHNNDAANTWRYMMDALLGEKH